MKLNRPRACGVCGFDRTRMVSVLRGIVTGAEIQAVPLVQIPELDDRLVSKHPTATAMPDGYRERQLDVFPTGAELKVVVTPAWRGAHSFEHCGEKQADSVHVSQSNDASHSGTVAPGNEATSNMQQQLSAITSSALTWVAS